MAVLNFLRLNDYLLRSLFENEDIIAVDKPYGIKTHANEEKSSKNDFLDEGLIEIYEQHLNQKLYVIHRLDQTTTGVVVFAKTAEAAKKYSEFFLNHQVQKTYFFITNKQNQKSSFVANQKIIYKGRNLDAETEFTIVKSDSGLHLWKASPKTGRNHQIRIHAQMAGLSLLGDEKYDGDQYPFLNLHNQRIEFPGGIVIESNAPIYFENLKYLKSKLLAKILFEADRRQRLFEYSDLENQCYRLAHCREDFKDFSFTLDHFGKIFVLSCYNDRFSEQQKEDFQTYSKIVKRPIIVRMMLNRGKDPLNQSRLVLGEDQKLESWVANENQLQFEMRSDSGQSFGLFLDQRLQRQWVLNNSKNKNVLNLFSYTCGFSVAAAKGNAKTVISVDTSKSVLNWGKKNFELNQIDLQAHRFLNRDSIEFLEYSVKKDIKYDLIICDPPSFSRGENGVFKIQDQLESLIKMCLRCLTKEGALLFSTNYENIDHKTINKIILKIKSELKNSHIQAHCIQSCLDFEIDSKNTILKSFLISNKQP